jgi:hypothetical protein
MIARCFRLGAAAALTFGLVAAPAAAAFAQTCRGVEGHAASFDGRRTFLLDPATMAVLRHRAATEPAFVRARAHLIARADAALTRGPYMVTDKRTIPPSGDRHDYLSVGPYWWPNPDTPTGLPYVRRDGEFNPDRNSNRYDIASLEAMSSDVETLGLAYYFTDDARYARHAARLLRAWFLDDATRMNPNMNFAQAVPGREAGRAEGIIDTSRLQRVIEAVGLIGPSGAIAAADQQGLEGWFSDYVDWLRTSANGREEDRARNNHSIWYDAQISQFALFARRPDVTETVVRAFAARRITPQFAADGSLPRELTRTRSLHYSVFALIAAYDAADMARCVGVDLWSFRDARGRGLRSATDFLAPYAGRISAWPHPEIRPDPDGLNDLLVRACAAWPDATYNVDVDRAALRRYFKMSPD